MLICIRKAGKARVNTSQVSFFLATKHATVAAKRGDVMPNIVALVWSLNSSRLRMHPEARSLMLNI